MRGRSLLPRHPAGQGGARAGARPVFAELLPATAWPHHATMMMVDGKHKLIHRISERRWELNGTHRIWREETLADARSAR